jgi:hypothetical protein
MNLWIYEPMNLSPITYEPMTYDICPMTYAPMYPCTYDLCPMPYALCIYVSMYLCIYALCPILWHTTYNQWPMTYDLWPMIYALCPIPYALCPITYALWLLPLLPILLLGLFMHTGQNEVGIFFQQQGHEFFRRGRSRGRQVHTSCGQSLGRGVW